MDEAGPVVVATKLPPRLRDQFAALAKRRNVTPSVLLRHLVERELAGAPDDVVGDVEAAVRAEIMERRGDVAGARSGAALNLARRMDRDPTSGAPNAEQLQLLLGELAPALDWARTELGPLDAIRLSVRLGGTG